MSKLVDLEAKVGLMTREMDKLMQESFDDSAKISALKGQMETLHVRAERSGRIIEFGDGREIYYDMQGRPKPSFGAHPKTVAEAIERMVNCDMLDFARLDWLAEQRIRLEDMEAPVLRQSRRFCWWWATRTIGAFTAFYELMWGGTERGTVMLAAFGLMGIDWITKRTEAKCR